MNEQYQRYTDSCWWDGFATYAKKVHPFCQQDSAHKGILHVHHLHYRSLWQETLEDVQIVMRRCIIFVTKVMVIMSNRKVSPHIAEYEVCDKWTGEVKLTPHIVYLFESVREELGKPIIITSGYRSEKYQAYLRSIGYPAAIISPHCYGAALDKLFPFDIDKDEFVNMLKTHSVALDFGICRIGRKKYNDAFLHTDLVYLLFEPYTTIQNPKPNIWKPGVSW